MIREEAGPQILSFEVKCPLKVSKISPKMFATIWPPDSKTPLCPEVRYDLEIRKKCPET